MKCKKCGFEWQSYGEALACPSCGGQTVLTQSEKQTLWEEAHEAEMIKDYDLLAKCYYELAEQGDERAAYSYAECLYNGVGVKANAEESVFWYRASARRMYPAAAYRLSVLLGDDARFGDSKKQSFFWLRVAAELGDSDAAVRLAQVYEKGDGVDASHRHALFWLMKAAKAGHGGACLSLSKSYFDGNGVEKDLAAARYYARQASDAGLRGKLASLLFSFGDSREPAEITLPTREEDRVSLGKEAEAAGEYAIAASLYFYAARGGNADATYRLGTFYEEGRGVPKSLPEARRRYGIAARADHPEATLRIARFLENGTGGDKDLSLARQCYEKLEEMNVAEGAYLLGEVYRQGKDVPVDFPHALRHYRKAAALGFKKAETALEELKVTADGIYERAVSLEERGEMKAAVKEYRTAAEMGHAASAYTIGFMIEKEAKGIEERREAVSFYRVSAEGGHIGGIYRLGLCYSRGYGVARNYANANSLLNIAAKKNYEGAAEELAVLKARKYRRTARRFYSISSVLYRKGKVAEAIKFRNIAAKLGSARAMFMLGCHLEFGDGVAPDRAKASAWYTRSIELGFDPARSDLKGGFLRARKKLLLTKKNIM